MIGWLIVLIISLVLAIVFLKLYNNSYDGWKLIVFWASILMVVVSIFVIPPSYFFVRDGVKNFEKYHEIVEITVVNDDTIDTAMNLKVLEYNEWLAHARTSEENYGIFSFYRGKIDDLEYITIEIEEE